MWVSQANYISVCASNKNKGMFNSIFFCIFQTASLICYPLAAILLVHFAKSTFYIIMTGIAFLGAMIFLLTQQPNPVTEPQEEVIEPDTDNEKVKKIEMSIF